MPYVNVRIIKTGVSDEQKAQVISGITQLLAEVLNKNPATTFVVIDEVPEENWGVGGEQLSARRARG